MIFMYISLLTLILLIAWYIPWTLRNDRKLDVIRQDHINKLLEESINKTLASAQLVIDRQTLLDDKINAAVRLIDRHSTSVNDQMRIIHSLVMSDMLSARRSELILAKDAKVSLERVIAVTTMARQPPAVRDVMALDTINNRIEELEAIIHEQVI